MFPNRTRVIGGDLTCPKLTRSRAAQAKVKHNKSVRDWDVESRWKPYARTAVNARHAVVCGAPLHPVPRRIREWKLFAHHVNFGAADLGVRDGKPGGVEQAERGPAQADRRRQCRSCTRQRAAARGPEGAHCRRDGGHGANRGKVRIQPAQTVSFPLTLTRRGAVLCRVAQRIAEDQMAVLQPDVETPFADAADVVRRLLPYHVFQHPAEDLHTLSGRKGKRKATEEDLLREEIAGSHTLQTSP